MERKWWLSEHVVKATISHVVDRAKVEKGVL